MLKSLIPAALFAGLLSGTALANDPAQPYAGQQHRPVKALSHDEMQGLLRGEGLGMAKAAELNHYPGPRHVLDLWDKMALDPALKSKVEALFNGMNAEARELGVEIIALERQLDEAFAAGTIDPASLSTLSERIGLLRGRLRAVHLATHLKLRPLLSEEQVARYDALRGYGDGQSGHDHGDHGKHSGH